MARNALRTRVVIDGDALLYPLIEAHRVELVEKDEIVMASVSLPAIGVAVAEGIYSAMQMLTEWAGAKTQVETIVAFSCPSSECFRREILPSYKSGRSKVKPLGFSLAKEQVQERYVCVTWPTLEADDILGILGTQPGFRTAIVGVDKDFNQIPAVRLNPSSGSISEPTVEEADLWHLRQTLTGDPSDGYKGAPGIGETKAAAILAQADRWSAIVAAFKGDEEEALRQARVARILRFSDWDSTQKRVRLWSPQ